MLQKGSKEYKNAQSLANVLFKAADGVTNDRDIDFVWHVITNVQDKCKGFAVDVANTIEKSMAKSEHMVRVSSKQAWVLSCALVEVGHDTEDSVKYYYL